MSQPSFFFTVFLEGLLTKHVVGLLLESITPGLQVKGKWATDKSAKEMSLG